jgi:anthranilate phosphoribosyltransferase
MAFDDPSILHSVIKRICTGPELSKDVCFEDARDAMRCIIDGNADDVQAALFLIGLRVKRETDEEFKGIQQALLDTSQIITAKVEQVVVLSDPYNGFSRHLPASPFLPAVLAALGIKTVSEGLKTVAPKFGITHHAVLQAAGKNVALSSQQAANQLAEPAIGWSYIDQSCYNPGLNALIPLRTLMVKRPVIATSERTIGPIRGQLKTHLITSYVHKAYPRVYSLLAEFAGFDTALLIKGVEGGITPSLRDQSKMISYTESFNGTTIDLLPEYCNISSDQRAQPIPNHLKAEDNTNSPAADAMNAAAQLSAQLGIAALQGANGYTRNSIIYSGAAILKHLGIQPTLLSAADTVKEVLDNGAAKAHFDAG